MRREDKIHHRENHERLNQHRLWLEAERGWAGQHGQHPESDEEKITGRRHTTLIQKANPPSDSVRTAAGPHQPNNQPKNNMNLKDLFLDELADMYDAEHRIIKALPKLAKAATCNELKQALLSHLEETKGQVTMLEQVFAAFDEKPKGKKCHAAVGLLAEGDEIAADNQGEPTINAALISAAQKMEHYEIASYGCLHQWATLLRKPAAASLLAEILAQEKAADETLNELAKEKNAEALECESCA